MTATTTTDATTRQEQTAQALRVFPLLPEFPTCPICGQKLLKERAGVPVCVRCPFAEKAR